MRMTLQTPPSLTLKLVPNFGIYQSFGDAEDRHSPLTIILNRMHGKHMILYCGGESQTTRISMLKFTLEIEIDSALISENGEHAVSPFTMAIEDCLGLQVSHSIYPKEINCPFSTLGPWEDLSGFKFLPCCFKLLSS